MVNGILLNFGKEYKDNLRVISDQWPKLHLDLDLISDQKILNGINDQWSSITYLCLMSKTYNIKFEVFINCKESNY